MNDAWRGFSFETLVLNELRAYNSYRKKGKSIFHYSATGAFDIDFIVETRKKILQQPPEYIALEVKLSNHWRPEWSQPLRSVASAPNSLVKSCYGVYTGSETIEDGPVTALSFSEFSRRLWAGQIF